MMTIYERLHELERLNQEMILLHAIEQYTEECGESLLQKNTELSQQEEYQLSDEELGKFTKSLNREYKKSQPHRHNRWVGRIAVAIVILMVIMLIAVCSVGAFRHMAIDLLIGLDDSYGTIQTYEELVGDTEIYPPTFIPDGYVQSNFQISSGDIVIIEYTNDSGSQIYFTQQSGGTGGVVDTENATIETVQINHSEGKLFVKENNCTLIWHDETNTFTLSGESKSTLVEMAESVQSER